MRILASPAFSNEKVNPYNALLYREINHIEPAVAEYSHKRALLGRYDIAHFHWPDGYINHPQKLKAWQRALLFLVIVVWLKLRGARIVWTVHNIFPHDAHHPQLSRRFLRWFAKQCDGLIFMSEQSQQQFFERYQPKHQTLTAVIPHGHYRTSYPQTVYPQTVSQQAARQALQIPPHKKVILCFGMIKPYKNIDGLITSFLTAKLSDYILIIAGSPDSPALGRRITELQAGHPQIKLFLEFIPDADVPLYHQCADLVILPYRAILNSGALLLALSFNRPVVAPHIGAFSNLQRELGAAWIHTYSDDLDADKLSTALATLEQQQRPEVCPLDNYDWKHLAEKTYRFYQGLNLVA